MFHLEIMIGFYLIFELVLYVPYFTKSYSKCNFHVNISDQMKISIDEYVLMKI